MVSLTLPQEVAFGAVIGFTLVLVLIGVLKKVFEGDNATGIFIGAMFLAGVMVLFTLLSALKWPGQPNSCINSNPDGCYCENAGSAALSQPGLIKQPINTLSAFAPSIAGLLILGMIDSDHRAGKRRENIPNLMVGRTTFSITYGLVVIFLGPGSMFFHASIGHFYSELDPLSMTLFTTFIILYDIFVLTGIADARILRGRMIATPFDHFLGIWLFTNFIFYVLMVAFPDGGLGTAIFGITVGIAVVMQIFILLTRGNINREWDFMGIALLCFLLAIFIWHWSKTGAPICRPDDMMQGHALWHVLAMAMAPFFIFKYFRTERWGSLPPPTTTTTPPNRPTPTR